MIRGPHIAQGYLRQWDIPVEIHLGEFLPDPRPAVYYRQIGVFTLYCLWHWRDWSTWPAMIRALDEHPWDFEGALIGPDWSASVFHREIKFLPEKAHTIWVEPAGHGIRFTPIAGPFLFLPSGSYKLIEITDQTVEVWRRCFEPEFSKSGVDMPWKWGQGLLWADPGELGRRLRSGTVEN